MRRRRTTSALPGHRGPARAVAIPPCAGQTKTVSETYDLICIGAGPTGLASAIEAKRAGMHPLVIDKACLCNSLYRYPTNMVFFTTPELLEIGDLPLTCAAEKPTRVEALKYYRKTAEHYQLDLRLYEGVERVEGSDRRFVVHTRTTRGIVNQDRKSTRLNSSHVKNSYAVFCLKKKNIKYRVTFHIFASLLVRLGDLLPISIYGLSLTPLAC